MVAGTVVINPKTNEILLISSSSTQDKYIIPKGGIETDEIELPEDTSTDVFDGSGPLKLTETLEEQQHGDYTKTALRETWEEAGVASGTLGPALPVILGNIPGRLALSHPYPEFLKCEYHFYELYTDTLEDKWPEDYKRKRMWVDPIKAVGLLKRQELIDAVKSSSAYKKALKNMV